MSVIPEHEINALKAMEGYEQMLEIDRLSKAYQVDEASIRATISSVPGQGPPPSTPAPLWVPSQKNQPQPSTPSKVGPALLNREQLRYEYDPSREAAQRREQINQAILCSACGVALGIPDVRPIKVTCPACLFETTYTE
ncbi:MAG: hypothetical protein CMA65_06265 [Euryarchaeota archaeon]|nr:hypothetical protein [Euryarchaeota archaeon]